MLSDSRVSMHKFSRNKVYLPQAQIGRDQKNARLGSTILIVLKKRERIFLDKKVIFFVWITVVRTQEQISGRLTNEEI